MKSETCFICKLGIDISKEDYAKVSDYHKGKFFKCIYCHVNCWQEHIGNKKLIKQGMEAIGKASEIINKQRMAA